MPLKEKLKKLNNIRFNPVHILAIGFLVMILIGTILLMLPISSSKQVYTPFIDALFTATSATCITGLVVVDTGTHWSFFGQIIILILIQVGALGFMTFSTLVIIILGKKVTLKSRLVIMQSYNTMSIQGLVRLVISVVIITFAIEAIGAVILSTQFVKEYSIGKAIYYGIFHSISSFCNAGFDLLGDIGGYTSYVTNPIIVMVVMILITLGSMGFFVVAEIISHRKKKRFSLHTKVVITSTMILILASSVFFFIFEYNNSKTMGKLSTGQKVLASTFVSITPRSGGVSIVPKAELTEASKTLTIMLMFIGGSPGSTGGGVKNTTIVVILMTIVCIVKGREDTEIFKRRIDKHLVYKSISIVTISGTIIIIVTMILSIFEKGSFIQFLFEATSALCTVGLSLDLTPTLSPIGKSLIVFCMYIGRIGPLALMISFFYKRKKRKTSIKYPEGKIIVG